MRAKTGVAGGYGGYVSLAGGVVMSAAAGRGPLDQFVITVLSSAEEQ